VNTSFAAMTRRQYTTGPSKFANKMRRNDRAVRIRITRHASSHDYVENPSAPLICNNTDDSWGRRGGPRLRMQ